MDKERKHDATKPRCARLAVGLKFLVFASSLGLIFNYFGYVPEHLRLFLVFVLLLQPILFASTQRKWLVLLVLIGAIGLNAFFHRNALFQVSMLLAAHYFIWTSSDRMWRPLYPAVAFYALFHIFFFMSPLGYYPLNALAVKVSALVAHWIRAECNLGYTYLNLGSLLLFGTLSLFMIRKPASAIRSICFLFIAVLLTAFIIKFVLFKTDLNAELMLALETYNSIKMPEYGEFYGKVMIILFPAILFLAHGLLFVAFHGAMKEELDPKDEAAS